MGSDIFEYDDNADYDTNYAKWRYMNNDEKVNFGEDIYPEEVAQRVFNEMYGAKLVKQKLLGRKRK